jgi:hypothetical protein
MTGRDGPDSTALQGAGVLGEGLLGHPLLHHRTLQQLIPDEGIGGY